MLFALHVYVVRVYRITLERRYHVNITVLSSIELACIFSGFKMVASLFCYSPARKSSVTINTMFYVSATLLLSFLSKLLITSHICCKCNYNCVSFFRDCEWRVSLERELVVNNDRFHTVKVTFSSLIYFTFWPFYFIVFTGRMKIKLHLVTFERISDWYSLKIQKACILMSYLFKMLHVATVKQVSSVPKWKWMQPAPEANYIIFKIAI